MLNEEPIFTITKIVDEEEDIDPEVWRSAAMQQRESIRRYVAGESDPLGLSDEVTFTVLRDVQRRRPCVPCGLCSLAKMSVCATCKCLGKRFLTEYRKGWKMGMMIATSWKPEVLQKIEDTGKEVAKCLGSDNLADALAVASGMQQLRKLITDDMMRDVMGLMNSHVGFRTDKDPASGKNVQPYSVQVVKDCFIESLARGLRPIGNEWNIISSRCYVTKEGFARIVRDLDGLTDLELEPGVPQKCGDIGALVPYYAKWSLDGETHEIVCKHSPGGDTRIPVRVNSQMGTDAILGKAKRKILARIYERVTGSTAGSVDEDGADVIVDAATSQTAEAATDQWLSEFKDLLRNCETMTDVADCWSRQEELQCPEPALARKMVADRKREIKSGRGERSNNAEA